MYDVFIKAPPPSAVEIIRSGRAILTTTVKEGKKTIQRQEVNPELARCFQGPGGRKVARYVLQLYRDDAEFQAAVDRQQIDVEAWEEWLDLTKGGDYS